MAPRGLGSLASSNRWGVVLLAVLLLAPALAGCLTEPSTTLRTRPGDLARIELVVSRDGKVALPADRAGQTVEALCGAPFDALTSEGCPESERAYALGEVPRLPEGWSNASSLPTGLVEALSGIEEGETRTIEDVQAWGPHREELLETHDRRGEVSRFVEDSKAYGRSWNGTRLENGTFRIDPGEEAFNASIRDPRWCNDTFCLFTSRLTDVNATHLILDHQAEVGDRVHVERLDTDLAVVEANATSFVVDGNDRRAGQAYDVYAKIVDVRAPPEGGRRAPGFNLTTVRGGSVQLAELLGQPVILEFFATWCPSCKENADHLAKVHERFGDRIAIVSIDVDPTDSPDAIRDFIENHGVDWPVAIDEGGEVSTRYSVGRLSTEVIVAPDGSIRHVETGVADHDRVVGIIETLLDEGEDA